MDTPAKQPAKPIKVFEARFNGSHGPTSEQGDTALGVWVVDVLKDRVRLSKEKSASEASGAEAAIAEASTAKAASAEGGV